jgi:hypothetical protein
LIRRSTIGRLCSTALSMRASRAAAVGRRWNSAFDSRAISISGCDAPKPWPVTVETSPRRTSSTAALPLSSGSRTTTAPSDTLTPDTGDCRLQQGGSRVVGDHAESLARHRRRIDLEHEVGSALEIEAERDLRRGQPARQKVQLIAGKEIGRLRQGSR